MSKHFAEYESLYPHRYQNQFGFYRPVIRRVIKKFLVSGDLTRGFAGVKCEHRKHEYLLAFSCRGGRVCPSWHQARLL